MDDHFLLKLPPHLTTKIHHDITINNYTNIEIYTRGDNTYFRYKETEYLSLFHDLPCIIEAHKTMDTRQFFKVDDVSTCLYVIDNEEEENDECDELDYYEIGKEISSKLKKMRELDGKSKSSLCKLLQREHELIEQNKAFCYSKQDINELRQKLELSGITPPLKFAKINTFRKKSERVKEIEEREHKIRELLEKDRHADRVEVEYINPDDYDDEDLETSDVSSFAAEIEYNLTLEQKEDMSEDIRNKKGLLVDIEEKIRKKEEQLMMATNLIVQKRFSESLAGLQEEREKILREIALLESDGGKKKFD